MPRLLNVAIGAAALLFCLAAGTSASEPSKAGQVKIETLSGAFLAARTAETDNDLASAVRFYEKAVALDSENEQLMQSLMLALIMTGDIQKALPYAEKLKAVPESERFSRIALAVSAINAKQFRTATKLLKLSLQSDLDRLIAEIMASWTLFGAGDAKEAIAYLDDIRGPSWYNLFVAYHKALIADAAGMNEAAASAYEKALELRDDGRTAPDTYLRLIEARARFFARTGEVEKALEVLAEADAFVSNRPRIEALRDELEKKAAAKPMVASAREGAAEILLNIATAINRPGSGSFVQYYLRLADALRPRYGSILVQMAMFAEQNGQSQAAIDFYSEIPADSPLKRVADLQAALNLADLGKNEDAETKLLALLDEQPDDLRAYLALGGVYASQENYSKSAALFDRAVAAIGEPEADDWNIFYQRGIAYERLKEWPKAEPNFLTALELYPDQPQVLNYLGYSWVDMNIRLEEGLDLIRKAVDLRPRDGYIVDSLGWAYYRLGRFEEAVAELERAVSLKPGDPIINDHLGDAYWRAGRRLEATFQWRQARDMDPEPALLAVIGEKLAKGLAPVNGASVADKPDEPAVKPEMKPATSVDEKG